MKINDFESFITRVFTREKLAIVQGNNEYGFTHREEKEIEKVGYCTNLTVDSAKRAAENGVDLLITHHDAWEWMIGMKEEAMKILQENKITHYFIHLPLDDADFGNNTTLLKKLGFESIESFAEEDGMYCGRVGVRDEAVEFEELVRKIEELLQEPILSWKNKDKKIKKLGVVTGAGFSVTNMKEAADMGCDAYLTGEKILYTVQYAQFIGMDLMVGSHTFTEIFGLEVLTSMLKDEHEELEVIRIEEDHIEIG